MGDQNLNYPFEHVLFAVFSHCTLSVPVDLGMDCFYTFISGKKQYYNRFLTFKEQ